MEAVLGSRISQLADHSSRAAFEAFKKLWLVMESNRSGLADIIARSLANGAIILVVVVVVVLKTFSQSPDALKLISLI